MSQQLVKKGTNGKHENVMPRSWIEAIKDKNTGQTLVEILQGFNMYFLPYNGNTSSTRCLVPTMLRKKGLWITYVKYDGNVYTEWYAANEIGDKSWGDSSNWRIGNNTLVGDITISANGNWVINGTETEFKAIGEKGNTPLLRVANNRLQVSYDLGDTYIDVTNNPVYTKFRWLATTGDTQANNVGRIQASTDEGKTWTNMSNDFTNNLHIKKYIGVNESLPTSGIAEGTIYAKGPYYAEDDTLNDNPIYRLWVYAWKGNTLAWQDNGEFTSIAAGIVQETGNSETEVMSQKAVTTKLSELGSEVNNILHYYGVPSSQMDVGTYGYSTIAKKILYKISSENAQYIDDSYWGTLWRYDNKRFVYTKNGLIDLDTTELKDNVEVLKSKVITTASVYNSTSDIVILHNIVKNTKYKLTVSVTALGYVSIYYLNQDGSKGSEIGTSTLLEDNSTKVFEITAGKDAYGFYIANANSTNLTIDFYAKGVLDQEIETLENSLKKYVDWHNGVINLSNTLYNQAYTQFNKGVEVGAKIRMTLVNDGTDKQLSGWLGSGTGGRLTYFSSLLPNVIKANETVTIEFFNSSNQNAYQIWLQTLNETSGGVVNVSVSVETDRIDTIESELVKLSNIEARSVMYVGADKEYIKFTDALSAAVAKGNVDIYVDAGEYDIINELGEAAILANLQAGYYGPIIGNDVNIYFASGAKIIANYTGNEKLIMTNFSPINSSKSTTAYKNNYKIFGGEFECSRVRYCVHDECEGKGTYTHEYHDCIMKLDNTNNEYWTSPQCIGGGLGEYSTIIIDGGVYDSVGATGYNPTTGLSDDTYKQCISYHQPTYTDAQGNYMYNTFKNYVSVKNVYFKHGTCLVSLGGGSTKLSIFEVTNCSMTFKAWLNGKNVQGVTQNFQMFEWNNNIR